MASTATIPLTWVQKLLWLTGCLVFFLMAYCAHDLFRNSHIDSELDQTVRTTEQQSPGWQLADLEAARDTVPDDENSAFYVQRAAQCLPQDGFEGYSHRVILLRGCRPNALDPSEALVLRTELDVRIEALAEALALAERPHGRYPFDLNRQPWNPPLTHISQVSQVVHLLTFAAICHSDQGEREEALQACRAAINAARSLGDEPLDVSQASRKYQAAVTVRGVQHLLNHGVWEPETLADLQRRLETEADHPACVIAMRGHRAQMHALLQAVESGTVSWNDVVHEPRHTYLLNWHATPTPLEIRCLHAELLPLLGRTVEVARTPPPQRAILFQDMVTENQTFSMLSLFLMNLPGLEQRISTCDAQLRCAVAALAVERYRCLHGCWPSSLQQLTPTFLKEMPVDPADGEPLRYVRNADGVAVFSKCLDERGRQYRGDETWLHHGVSVRLWDVDQRGRPAPPPSPEERRP